jgi:hypothetical protein
VVEAFVGLKSFGKTHSLSLGGITICELRRKLRPRPASRSMLR